MKMRGISATVICIIGYFEKDSLQWRDNLLEVFMF